MLKCLKYLENDDPEGAKVIYQNIMSEIYKAAGVTKEEWDVAENRVYYDGWFGPLRKEDWLQECDNPIRRKFADLGVALKVIEKGMCAGISDVEFWSPDFDFCGFEDESEETISSNCIIEAETIKEEIFGWYYKIYGR